MTPSTPSTLSGYGLSRLARVPLPPERLSLMEALQTTSQGSPVWRARKAAEVRDLFALEAIAPRVNVLAVDSATELLAIVRLVVPTPCLPLDGELVVLGGVLMVLHYPEAILHGPLPGYALVQIQQPRRVWHPNVSSDSAQRLCLGANVPKGLPLREALLGSYAALTLQSITLDRADPAGIMNPEALRYWNDNAGRIPLSRAAFLDEPDMQLGSSPDPSSMSEASR